MKKIVVPTDFSACARAAENLGIELALKAHAEIHFLHVVTTPVDWVDLPLEKEKLYPETREMIGHATNELNVLVDRAQKLGLNAKPFLLFNKFREEIDEQIKQHHHDFVVMGSNGAKGFKQVIGSNAQKVLRHADVPVLIVKEKLPENAIKDILFASTFDEEVHAAFRKMVHLADLLGAKIHLLYVNMPFLFRETDDIEASIAEFLSKYPRLNCSVNIFDALNEERGIQKFGDKINADLIALATHGRTGIRRMMRPSITESIVNQSEKPVLSISAAGHSQAE
ncbi:MAG: universal stress protein [Bacteroidetes bacterium]|nr:universal stress protein [Bacteroidota bacterium]